MTGRPSWAAGPRSFGPPPSRRGPGGATWRAVREAIDLLNQLAAIADVAEQGDLAALEKIMEGTKRAPHCANPSLNCRRTGRSNRERRARVRRGSRTGPRRRSGPSCLLLRSSASSQPPIASIGWAGLILDMPKFDAQAEPAAPSRPANEPAGGELDVMPSDIRRLLASGKGDLPRLTEHEGKHAKAARSRSTSWPRSSRQELRDYIRTFFSTDWVGPAGSAFLARKCCPDAVQ